MKDTPKATTSVRLDDATRARLSDVALRSNGKFNVSDIIKTAESHS